MAGSIENNQHFIPIPTESLVTPTGQSFKQRKEIPVEISILTLPQSSPLYYACFNLPPVFIPAGGGTIEKIQHIIRWQMVYRYLEALRPREDPLCPSNAAEQRKVLKQFIRLRKKANVQPCL